MIGYPDEDPPLRDRLPLELVVHQEKYERLDDEALVALHADREQKAWVRYNENPELQQKLADNGIRRVTDFYTSEFKYGKERHAKISEMLLETLQQQKLWL